MGRARSMYGGDERHMQDFSAEAWGKKNTWRTHTHTRARARTLQYVITFPRLQKSVFINAPQYYVMRILPVSFYVTVRTLSTKNPTWTCLNSNPGLRHDRRYIRLTHVRIIWDLRICCACKLKESFFCVIALKVIEKLPNLQEFLAHVFIPTDFGAGVDVLMDTWIWFPLQQKLSP